MEGYMQSNIGNVNFDKVFQTLSKAHENYIAGASPSFVDDMGCGAMPNEVGKLLMNVYSFNVRKIAEIQAKLVAEQMSIWARLWSLQTSDPIVKPLKGDRRFDAPEWNEYPLFDYVKQAYLATSNALLQVIESANLDEKTKREMIFFARHFVDAVSPANYALTNPEVLKLAIETKGESFESGLRNLREDINKGYISLSDEAAFEVGGNLANTPGAVVFENELIQLIQYQATTDKVHATPLVIIPSVVNKFYILDLTPESSFVRYCVSQGYTVFMVSWRNINPALQNLSWDDYVEKGVIKAVDVACEVAKLEKVNALGYCVGGSLLACALGVLKARKKNKIASMTQLIAMLDYSDPGEIGVYLDQTFTVQRLKLFAGGEIVSGKELSRAFASLRANDLIWSFVINNYLKGKLPNAFDLFYWNSDDSNLPGPMFSSYLQDCYADNKLARPNAMKVCGEMLDLRVIDVPTYVFNASEDHLVPWKAGYESVRLLSGDVQFVLGGGGHITGPVNPISKNKRNYWVDGDLGQGADDWLKTAQSIQGSWWPHYVKWLSSHSGKEIAAPKKLGSAAFPQLEAAPGRYVKERAL